MLDVLKFKIKGDNQSNAAFAGVKKNLKGVDGMLATVGARAKRVGRGMRNIGAGMSIGVTAPIVLMAKASLGLFKIQQSAEAAVIQVVKSTGGAAGKTAKELFSIASGLQEITAFGDEDILRNLTTPLATFTKISGPQFERTQLAILDMATTLKMDLKPAALQVGKALNDPAKGISALSKSGIQFSKDQENMIKTLAKTGRVAEAQNIILKELETQFGGQAAAFRATEEGKWQALQNSIGDVKEQLGEQIVPFLTPVMAKVTQAVNWFGKLSPEVKKNIVMFGALAAVAGPVLTVLGLGAMAIAPLIGVLGALLSPIGLVVGGVALLGIAAYKSWDEIKVAYPGIAGVMEVSFDKMQSAASAYWEYSKSFWSGTAAVALAGVDVLDKLLQGDFKGAWAATQGYVSDAWDAIGGAITDGIASAKSKLTTFMPALDAIWQPIETEISGWPTAFTDIGGKMIDGLTAGIRSKWAGFKGWFNNLIGEMPEWARNKLEINSPSRVFEVIGGQMVAGLSAGIDKNTDDPKNALTGVLSGIASVFKGVMLSDTSGWNNQTTGILKTADALETLSSKTKKAEKSSTNLMDNGLQSLKGQLSSLRQGTLSVRDAIGNAFGSMSDKLWDLVLDNGWNMLKSILGGLGGGGGGIGGGIVGSIVSFLGFAKGGVFQNGSVTPFARGGVVGSPTLFPMKNGTGLMGEAGPEAILPLTRSGGKLGVNASGLGGGGGKTIVFDIDINIETKSDEPASIGDSVAAEMQKIMTQVADGRIFQSTRPGGVLDAKFEKVKGL